MIRVSFNEYNENDLVCSHIKEFVNEQEMRKWFRSQQGHPYLSFSNIKIIDF